MEVIVIDMDTDYQRAISDAVTPNEQRKIGRDYIMKNLRGIYILSDGKKVMISRKTAEEYTHKAPELKLRAIPELANMLMNSTLINVRCSYKLRKNFKYFEYYGTPFEINGTQYVAELNIGITAENEVVLYDVNKFKEK